MLHTYCIMISSSTWLPWCLPVPTFMSHTPVYDLLKSNKCQHFYLRSAFEDLEVITSTHFFSTTMKARNRLYLSLLNERWELWLMYCSVRPSCSGLWCVTPQTHFFLHFVRNYHSGRWDGRNGFSDSCSKWAKVVGVARLVSCWTGAPEPRRRRSAGSWEPRQTAGAELSTPALRAAPLTCLPEPAWAQQTSPRAGILGRGHVSSLGEGEKWGRWKTRQMIHMVSQWERTECNFSLVMIHSYAVYSSWESVWSHGLQCTCLYAVLEHKWGNLQGRKTRQAFNFSLPFSCVHLKISICSNSHCPRLLH